MRSRIAAALVGGAFLLAGAPMALAKSPLHDFKGEVSHLDSTAKTLSVKAQGGKMAEMHFTLAPDAKIMQGPKARSLAELKPGERVWVTYTDEGSMHQASRIEVLPARTARAEPSGTSGSKPSNY